MQFEIALDPAHQSWLEQNHYSSPSLLARGRTSGVWKVQRGPDFFAAKIEHRKSRRQFMLEKEALHLQMVNEQGIGPRFDSLDANARVLVMQFIDGIPLAHWIKKCNSAEQMQRVLKQAFAQAKQLDDAGIDHGQLGGKLHNIMVDENDKVFIIDFEKAGYTRKTHNVSKLRAELFHTPKSIPRKIKSLLGQNAEQRVLQ